MIRQPGHRSFYEVAVLTADGNITYDTPITQGTSMGVRSFLQLSEVEPVLDEIAALPAA